MDDEIMLYTSKLLYTIFYSSYNATIKEVEVYENNEKVNRYYITTKYEDSYGTELSIKVTYNSKETIPFSIEEICIYLILIMNAKRFSNSPYHISMQKIRKIRKITSNSVASYNKHKMAIDNLVNRKVTISVIKSKYPKDYISSSMLCISNIKENGRIKEFDYSFGKLDSIFVKSKQFMITKFNVFAIPFSQEFKIQLSIYLLRMIFMNKCKNKVRNISLQNMLNNIYKCDIQGKIENITYYDYISDLTNKRTEAVNNIYEILIYLLTEFKKLGIIKNYSISKNRTYRYIKDDEVNIKLNFVKSNLVVKGGKNNGYIVKKRRKSN